MARPPAPFDSFVEKSDGCWLWRGDKTPDGYGRLSTYGPAVNGRRPRTYRYAHRVAWEREHGEITDGLWVLHRCDNPPCVRADHLFLGTNQDNINDAALKGRLPGRAVVTPLEAAAIRTRLRGGAALADVSRECGLTERALRDIRAGRTWRHLPTEPFDSIERLSRRTADRAQQGPERVQRTG